MKNIIYNFILAIILVVVFIIGFSVFYNSTDEDKIYYENSKELILNINELRLAINKFYIETGEFPNLCEEDFSNISALKKDGTKMYFKDIYNRNKLPYTPSTEKIEKSNSIIDTNDFKNATLDGGWLYDYKNQTGEIHINLPFNALNQGIEWIKI